MKSVEIQSVQLLGNGQDLAWEWSPKGLKIRRPADSPCRHVFVFKIERKAPY